MTVRRFDPQQTHETRQWKHEQALTTCRVDPTGSFVFAGAEDYGIHRWDLNTGEKVTLRGHESWVRSLDFSPDGSWLYSAGWDGQLRWWNALDSRPRSLRMVRAHVGFNRWVHADPAGEHLATCGNDKRIRVWKAKDGALTAEFKGHQRHPYAVLFHPRQKRLVSEDLMGDVRVWDLADGQLKGQVNASIMTGYDNKFAADMGGARDMRFSAEGATLACAGITNVVNAFAGVQDPIIVLIDWETRRITHHLRPAPKTTGIAWGVRFHRSGVIVGAVARQNGKGELIFWRPRRHRPPAETASQRWAPLEEQPLHIAALPSPARAMDFIPPNGTEPNADPTRVAVAHADGTLRVYRMAARPRPPVESPRAT